MELNFQLNSIRFSVSYVGCDDMFSSILLSAVVLVAKVQSSCCYIRLMSCHLLHTLKYADKLSMNLLRVAFELRDPFSHMPPLPTTIVIRQLLVVGLITVYKFVKHFASSTFHTSSYYGPPTPNPQKPAHVCVYCGRRRASKTWYFI